MTKMDELMAAFWAAERAYAKAHDEITIAHGAMLAARDALQAELNRIGEKRA